MKKNKTQLLEDFHRERNLKEQEYYSTDFGVGQFIGFILAGLCQLLPYLIILIIFLALIQ